MPIKRLCSFCGNDIEPGTGKMFVRRDGTVFFFCKSKCQRNLLHLGRVPRTVRWTRAAIQAKARAKGLVVEEARLEAAADEGEAPAAGTFTIQLPKGKAVPPAIRDLIERRLGPGLSATEVEGKFKEFSNSNQLREFLGVWYGKRHPKKKVTEVELSEYVAFLETSTGKKVLKDWLETEAKKEKATKEA